LLKKINSLEKSKFCQNFVYSFMRFIVSIKGEDERSFKEQLKLLDRILGGAISFYKIDRDLTRYVTLLENKSDLGECAKCIENYFENCQQ